MSNDHFKIIINNYSNQIDESYRKISNDINNGISLLEILTSSNLSILKTKEIYYKVLWNNIIKEKKLDDITKEEELILDKYLLFNLMNNKESNNITLDNNDVIGITAQSKDITKFIENSFNHYLRSNTISEYDLQILTFNKNYKIEPKKYTKLEEITKIIKGEFDKYVYIKHVKINNFIKGLSTTLSKKDIKEYLQYGNVKKIEELKQYIKQNKTHIKADIIEIVNDEIERKSFDNFCKEYILTHLNILDNISDLEQIKYIKSLDEIQLDELKKQIKKKEQTKLMPYEDYRIKRNYKSILLNKENNTSIEKKETKKIENIITEEKNINTEITKKIDEFELINICKKAIQLMKNHKENISDELKLSLLDEDFSLLDYFTMINIDIKDMYYLLKRNSNKKDKIITREEVNIYQAWLRRKFGDNLVKTRDQLTLYEPLTTKADIYEGRFIIKGREITPEEREKVYNFLQEKEIPTYIIVFKNALRRYARDELIDRYNLFKEYCNKELNNQKKLTKKRIKEDS